MKTQGISCLLAALLLSVGAETAQAQLKISYGKDQEPRNFKTIVLRPNQEQSISFSYQVQDDPKLGLKIALDLIDEQGNTKPVGQAVFDKRLKNEKVQVKFPPTAAGDKGDAGWTKLNGPPFQFRFKIEEKKGAEPMDDVELVFEEPRDLIRVAKSNYNPEKKSLSITLEAKQQLDSPCEVKLELPPSVNLGLKESTAGTRKGVLDAKTARLELVADDIQFEGKPPSNGRVYLTVDGIERAFIFKCDYSEGSLVSLDKTRARMVLPRFVQPGPKVAVRLEVDGQSRIETIDESPQRAKVEVEFDRNGDGKSFVPVAGSPFRGLRHQEIYFKIDPTGAMIFKTVAKDRLVELNADDIGGRRALRLRLTDAKGKVLDLADEQDDVNEKVALYDKDLKNRSAVLSFNKSENTITGEFVIDKTKPADLEIDAPESIVAGADLTPKLTLKARQPNEAPIGKVIFFLGELEDGDKIPATGKKSIIEGRVDPTGAIWTPEKPFKVPADAKEKIYLSALATTMTDVAVGKTRTIQIKVPVVAGKDAKEAKEEVGKKKGPATIKGTVVIGPLAQPGIKVYLRKVDAAKTAKPKVATTDDDGNYEFKNIEPGEYVLSTIGRDGRIGSQPIEIEGTVPMVKADPLSLKVK